MTSGAETVAEPRWRQALASLTPDRRRVLYAFGAAILVFVVGDLLHSGFASATSVKSILVIASFVGLVSAGQTFVILVGGIDLSVPWVLNAAAILLVTSSLGRDGRAAQAVLLTLALGLATGLVNGIGIAYLAVPAVVMTLGMNGIMEGLTLGLSKGLTCASCASYAPKAVQDAVNKQFLGIPTDLFLWLVVALLITFVLSATTFGRRIYAIGNNDAAAFLAGINVRLVTVALYMISGLFSALAGIVLVGYGGQATLGMGDPYLFQSIAAAVIGGLSILGGRGHYLGTLAGSITLVALISVLLAENMPDWGRNVVYGIAILVILLVYGRERRQV
ncbi:MAG TPA: ABC transporter permease [Gaiellaceae bacterium]|jgi:ribose transport system permease protein